VNAFTIIVIGGVLYFCPSLIAGIKHHRNLSALFALNLLLGWTVIGWVAALVWSLMNQDKPAAPATAPAPPMPTPRPREESIRSQEAPLPIIQMSLESEPEAQPTPQLPTEQDWVRKAKAELANSRRK